MNVSDFYLVMVTENDPFIARYTSSTGATSSLNGTSFNVGIIESMLRCLGFDVIVTSVHTPTTKYPNKTVFLISQIDNSIQIN